MIPGSANSLLLASAAGAAQYQIERSLRFNSADSAYLSRTPSSAGNRKTWTWAGWVKRGALGGIQELFIARTTDADRTGLGIVSDQIHVFFNHTAGFRGIGQAFLRDQSAWYHIVLSIDTTQAVASDRIKLWINNGLQIVSTYYGSIPSQNASGAVNNTVAHAHGSDGISVNYLFNGYLADIHFIDGQSLTPSSFGYTDSNGIWQPKAYTGTYGTNGFHLDFADNSAASTAGIGKDVSGNGNHWTPNNLSVASGAGNDSLVDTPTNYGTDTGVGGEVRGNYCTWNPLEIQGTLSNGNLAFAGSGGFSNVRSTIGITSGKYYWEIIVGAADTRIGISTQQAILSPGAWFTNSSTGWGYYSNDGRKYTAGSSGVYGSTFTAGDIIGVAFDADSGSLTFHKNNVSQGVAYTGLTGQTYFPTMANANSTASHYVNFGQRPFAYTAPSGYKALCTQNLFSTTITTSGSYTGNGSADGPFVYLNGVPTAMTINGNAVTFGTEADKLSNGFKVRTASTTYNQNAATYNYSITSTGDPFKVARAQSNP